MPYAYHKCLSFTKIKRHPQGPDLEAAQQAIADFQQVMAGPIDCCEEQLGISWVRMVNSGEWMVNNR